jgi:signal transduction histidine kinase
MLRAIQAKGLFYWLRAPRNYADLRHDERALARARLVLSAACLGAILWVAETRNLELNWKLPLAYLVYSLLVLLALRFYPRWNPKYHTAVHCADIFWAAQLTILTGWSSIFFALMIFVMASSGARWGFWEALLTAFLLWSAVFSMQFIYDPTVSHPFELVSNLDFFPAGFLSLALVLAYGYLGEIRAARSEGDSIARIIQGIRLENGFENAFHKICLDSLSLFGAVQILVAFDDSSSAECVIYKAIGPQAFVEFEDVPALRHGQYFFQAPARSWSLSLSRMAHRSYFRCLKLESGKVTRDRSGFKMPDTFLAAHPFRQLLVVSASLKYGGSARVFIVDPLTYFGSAAALRFLEGAIQQLAPTISDLFALDRIKAKAEIEAVGRMAREIHDGAIQSLAAINLHLEMLRRQMAAVNSEEAETLAAIQKNIRAEIASLRELTQQMRSLEIDADQLPGFLANLAVKYQCEYGIATKFVQEVDAIRLRPVVCTELARIAQEALVNIRKHSKASEVLIRLRRVNGNYVLGIYDNGSGFGFSGRYSHKELQISGKGPAVIMERAQRIRGDVTIESVQGTGSSLEITFPDRPSER